MLASSSTASRRTRAVESFKTASDCIGPVHAGMSVFAVTRGQFSMIDAILHVLDQVGPAKITLWTWTVAEYEVQSLDRLRLDGRVTAAELIIDTGAKVKNTKIIENWKASFGPGTVRYVVNHSKMATVESATGLKVLLRGSCNLNNNPRFEQLDVTEGGPDFDLVKQIESELPKIGESPKYAEIQAASRVGDAFTPEDLKAFGQFKVWAK